MAVALRGETSAAAELGIMEGYKPDTYGNGISDVYDAWYHDISDISSTVRYLGGLASTGPALELGIGTGRIAGPLAAAGVDVWGVDASEKMVALLQNQSPELAAKTCLGDMAAMVLPANFPENFEAIFITFNTLCNLTTAAEQQACIRTCGELLSLGGHVVIECFVPAEISDPTRSLAVKSVELDRVILTASVVDPVEQSIVGQHIEITESGGVRLRPFVLRYLTPSQLDAMAVRAGLVLVSRYADWNGIKFTDHSPVHVSTYARSQ